MKSLDLTRNGQKNDIALKVGTSAFTYSDLCSLISQWKIVFKSSHKILIHIRIPRALPGLVCYLAALESGHSVILSEGSLYDTDRICTFKPDLIVGSTPTFSVGYSTDPSASSETGVAVERLVHSNDDPPLNESLAVIAATSGTSSQLPKYVRLSFANLNSNASSIAECLGLDARYRCLTSLRADFSFGLSIINSHLSAGASLALETKPPTSHEFWWNASNMGANSVGLIPGTLRSLLGSSWSKSALTSLKMVQVAGGPCDVKVLQDCATLLRRHGGTLFSMYGQTEATARISCLPSDLIFTHPSSVGRPVIGGSVSIVDRQSNPVADGCEGNIIYRGPNVMMGYATSRLGLSTGDQLEGILDTGDVGRIHDGLLYITGRHDRQVKILGVRVNLDEVEIKIARLGIVKQAACVMSVPNVDVVSAYVVANDVCDGDVVEQLNAHSEHFDVPRGAIKFHLVSNLPFTESGKVRYHSLE